MTSLLAPAPQPSDGELHHAVFGIILLAGYILLLVCFRKPEYLLYPCLKLVCIFILGPLFVCAIILFGPFYVCFKVLQMLIAYTRHRTGQADHLDIESGDRGSVAGVAHAAQPNRPPDWSGYYEVFSHQKVGECSICLGEFEEQDECARLRKCNHMYHRQCMDLWLPKSCPICRQSNSVGSIKDNRGH